MPIKNRIKVKETKLKEMCELASVEIKTTVGSLGQLVSFSWTHYCWFKQAEARFSLEKLGSGGATGTERANSAQFIRLAREVYGLRYKRQAKHLSKKYSNIIPDAVGFSVAKQRKKCPINFSVLALGKI